MSRYKTAETPLTSSVFANGRNRISMSK